MRNIQPGSLMLILTRASDSHIDNSHWDWIHANGCVGIDSQPRNFSSRHYLVHTTQNMTIAWPVFNGSRFDSDTPSSNCFSASSNILWSCSTSAYLTASRAALAFKEVGLREQPKHPGYIAKRLTSVYRKGWNVIS